MPPRNSSQLCQSDECCDFFRAIVCSHLAESETHSELSSPMPQTWIGDSVSSGIPYAWAFFIRPSLGLASVALPAEEPPYRLAR